MLILPSSSVYCPRATPQSQCEHWAHRPGRVPTHRSRAPRPKPCRETEGLVSNYLHKPWRNLFVGVKTPVRGKIKSDVCRKCYTRLPQGKIFISFPESSLYFSYLSGIRTSESSFCIPQIHPMKMRTSLPWRIFQIPIKIEWKEWSAGWRAAAVWSANLPHTPHTHAHTHSLGCKFSPILWTY